MKIIKNNRKYKVLVAIKWTKNESVSIEIEVPCQASCSAEAIKVVKRQAHMKIFGYKRMKKGLNLFGIKQYQVTIGLMDVNKDAISQFTVYVEANGWWQVKPKTKQQYYMQVSNAYLIKGNRSGRMKARVVT